MQNIDASASEERILATVPVSEIRESGTNPRTTFDEAKQNELTESVRRHGVLQPLLLRRTNRGFEVVCGHRRLRAAVAAELGEVPAVVRSLSDREALEIQFIENLQREDLNPMEEAEGYSRLVSRHGYRVQDLALKLDKSEAYVYSRLKLVDLPKKAVKSLAAGELSLSAAFLVARIPDAKLRERAADAVVGRWDRPMRAREARRWIQQNCMLRLTDAPFPTDEEMGGAGPCTRCPKRTRNAPALFADFGEDDLCTDPKCFKAKREAMWNRLKAQAKEGGRPVMDKKTSAKVFDKWLGLKPGSGFVSPDEKIHLGDGPAKTYAKHLGGDAPAAIVARNPHSGEIVELFDKAQVLKVLRGKGVDLAAVSGGLDPKSKELARKEKERRRIGGLVEAAVLRELVSKAEALDEVTEEAWRLLALSAIKRAWYDTLKTVSARRGLRKTGEGWRPETALADLVAESDTPAVRGLVFEIVTGPFLGLQHDCGLNYEIQSNALLAFGIDPKAIKKRIEREEKAKAKAKSPKAKKAQKRARDSRQTKGGR